MRQGDTGLGVQRRGKPRSVAELARHDVVLYRGSSGRTTWELIGPRGTELVEVQGALSGDSFQFVLEAVAAGHGIGLMPEHCFFRSLAPHAQIVPVLPKLSALGALQSLVHPSRHLPKRVKLLREFLTEHLLSECRGHNLLTERKSS